MAARDDTPAEGRSPEPGAALPSRPAPKPLALGAAVVAVALLGWLAYELSSDGPAPPPEEALPPLPEPGEPRSRPMVSAGGRTGWTWVNPRPRALPTLYAVASTDEGRRAIFVGADGAVLRYEPRGLLATESGTTRSLRGVAWVDEATAIAVGEGGVARRIAGGRASPIETGVEVDLRAAARTGPGQALAVGDGGVAVALGPDGARPVALGTEADLLGVYVRGEETFAVGAGGTVVRLGPEGPRVEPTPTSAVLRAVGGCPSSSRIYAAGDRGAVLLRGRDGSWRALRAPREGFTGVSCDHGRVAAVSAQGRVLLISGENTLELPSGFDRVWHGVAGAERGRSWLVGIGGRVATIQRDHVRTRTAGPTYPIRALGAMGGALVAVGEWGRVVQQRESGFRERESPTESGLAAVAQLDEGRLLAVGDYGAIVDLRFDGAELLASPIDASLRGAVGSAGDLLIVGAGGVVLRGPIGGLRATRVPDVGDLHGLSGDPGGAIAVGDRGAVLRLDREGFARVSCDLDVTLRAVARWADAAWAVGDDGVVLRIEPDECVLERRGGPTLHAVGPGPEGPPMAVGDDGVALVRGDDGEWRDAGLDVGGASLRAVWRSRRSVYVAGTGGVIARHVRLDGE